MNSLDLHAWPEPVKELIGPIRRIEIPGQGATSEVVIVQGDHGEFVVKRAAQPPFDQWLRRESQVLAALRGSGLAVPEVYLYLEQGTGTNGNQRAGGRCAWLVMQRLPGLPLRSRLRDEPDPAVRRRLLEAFGQAVRTVHAAVPPASLAAEGPWLDVTLERARWHLEHFPVDGTEELLEHLRAHRPRPVPATLIHGDCTMDNVLVDGERISGFIDWCWGAVGDPRYDLALATAPKPEAFREEADLEAFYEGYGGERLSPEETAYFLGLYEFF